MFLLSLHWEQPSHRRHELPVIPRSSSEMQRKLLRLITYPLLRFHQAISIILHMLVYLIQYQKSRPSNSCIITENIIPISHFISHNPIQFSFLSCLKSHLIKTQLIISKYFRNPSNLLSYPSSSSVLCWRQPIDLIVLSKSIPAPSCHFSLLNLQSIAYMVVQYNLHENCSHQNIEKQNQREILYLKTGPHNQLLDLASFKFVGQAKRLETQTGFFCITILRQNFFSRKP